MESGKLTRASVREGLVASCLEYSCVYNNVPISRNDIMKIFNCSTKCLSKGEKVFCQILENIEEYKHLIYKNVDICENDSFVKYCSLLNMHFSVSTICNEIFEKYKIELQAVTPKSSIGGILTYVIKYKLKLKTPTKSEISKLVNVCTPTINKVIDLIKE